MGFVLQPTAHAQTVDVPIGITTGTLRTLYQGCELRGVGKRDDCVIKIDDALGVHVGLSIPFGGGVPQTADGQPISSYALCNLTIDADDLATLTTLLPASALVGPTDLLLEDVLIKGHNAATLALGLNGVHWTMRRVEIRGDGSAITVSNGNGHLRDVEVFGGRGGLIAAGNATQTRFDARGFRGINAYWQGPSGEDVTATAYGDLYVDVESHEEDDRDLYDVLRVRTIVDEADEVRDGAIVPVVCQVYDRVEDATGVWGQVDALTDDGFGIVVDWHRPNSWIPAAPPSDEVVVYRLTLGRLSDWTTKANRLSLRNGAGTPPSPHWRSPTGGYAATPSVGGGSRLDICRKKIGVRDVDVGGIHLTDPCVDCLLEDVELVGWWSDQLSMRGLRNRARRVKVRLGQDIGITNTGQEVLLDDCDADANGFLGFLVQHAAGSPYSASVTMRNCRASDNGTHDNGSEDGGQESAGWGARVYEGVAYIKNFSGTNRAGLLRLPG